MKKYFWIFLIIGFSGFFSDSSAQRHSDANENILKLMNEIFALVPEDIPEIDPELGRIAVYRIETEGSNISAPLRKHFENRLVEILRTLGEPAVVTLPDLNTLKISSTDSSFSIINSLPAPDELWRVARKLRVQLSFPVRGELVEPPLIHAADTQNWYNNDTGRPGRYLK